MIAIKDMDMPSCCGKCGFCGRFNPDEDICGADGHIFTSTLATITKNRDSRCPLIEIERSEDCVSRQAVINTILEDSKRTGINHRYTSSDNMRNEIDDIKALPSVTPTQKTYKDCKQWKDSDGVYRRGFMAESKCPMNISRVLEGNFYCADFERRE